MTSSSRVRSTPVWRKVERAAVMRPRSRRWVGITRLTFEAGSTDARPGARCQAFSRLGAGRTAGAAGVLNRR